MNTNYTIGIHLEATGAVRAAVDIKKVRQEVAHLEQNQNIARAGLQASGALLAVQHMMSKGNAGNAAAANGTGSIHLFYFALAYLSKRCEHRRG